LVRAEAHVTQARQQVENYAQLLAKPEIGNRRLAEAVYRNLENSLKLMLSRRDMIASDLEQMRRRRALLGASDPN